MAKTGKYAADKVIVSPMRRCIETAEILFPEIVNKEGILKSGNAFREMNFWAFEYMTYEEINNHPNSEYRAAYQETSY